MRNKYVFDYPISVVYQAIAQLIVDNANVHTQNKYTVESISKIDYKFEVETNMGTLMNYSKVTDVQPDKLIAYTIHREKLEKYLVTYDLEALDESSTRLDYHYEVQTEKKATALNHALVSWLYKRKQSKKFKEMCKYLNTQCQNIVNRIES